MNAKKALATAVRLYCALVESETQAETKTLWSWEAARVLLESSPRTGPALIVEMDAMSRPQRAQVMRYAGAMAPFEPMGEVFVFAKESDAKAFATQAGQLAGGIVEVLTGNIVAACCEAEPEAVRGLAAGLGGAPYRGAKVTDRFESVETDLPFRMIDEGKLSPEVVEKAILRALEPRPLLESRSLRMDGDAPEARYTAALINFAMPKKEMHGVSTPIFEALVKRGYLKPAALKVLGEDTTVEGTKGPYAFADKEAQYAGYNDAQLAYAVRDAGTSMQLMRNHDPDAEAWYADDVHTIQKEINNRRRRNEGKLGEADGGTSAGGTATATAGDASALAGGVARDQPVGNGSPATSKSEPQKNVATNEVPAKPAEDATALAGQVTLEDGTVVPEDVLRQAAAKILANIATQLQNNTGTGQPAEPKGDEADAEKEGADAEAKKEDKPGTEPPTAPDAKPDTSDAQDTGTEAGGGTASATSGKVKESVNEALTPGTRVWAAAGASMGMSYYVGSYVGPGQAHSSIRYSEVQFDGKSRTSQWPADMVHTGSPPSDWYKQQMRENFIGVTGAPPSIVGATVTERGGMLDAGQMGTIKSLAAEIGGHVTFASEKGMEITCKDDTDAAELAHNIEHTLGMSVSADNDGMTTHVYAESKVVRAAKLKEHTGAWERGDAVRNISNGMLGVIEEPIYGKGTLVKWANGTTSDVDAYLLKNLVPNPSPPRGAWESKDGHPGYCCGGKHESRTAHALALLREGKSAKDVAKALSESAPSGRTLKKVPGANPFAKGARNETVLKAGKFPLGQFVVDLDSGDPAADLQAYANWLRLSSQHDPADKGDVEAQKIEQKYLTMAKAFEVFAHTINGIERDPKFAPKPYDPYGGKRSPWEARENVVREALHIVKASRKVNEAKGDDAGAEDEAAAAVMAFEDAATQVAALKAAAFDLVTSDLVKVLAVCEAMGLKKSKRLVTKLHDASKELHDTIKKFMGDFEEAHSVFQSESGTKGQTAEQPAAEGGAPAAAPATPAPAAAAPAAAPAATPAPAPAAAPAPVQAESVRDPVDAAIARLVNTNIPERIKSGESLRTVVESIRSLSSDLALDSTQAVAVYDRFNAINTRTFEFAIRDRKHHALLAEVAKVRTTPQLVRTLAEKTANGAQSLVTERELEAAIKALRRHGMVEHKAFADDLEARLQAVTV